MFDHSNKKAEIFQIIIHWYGSCLFQRPYNEVYYELVTANNFFGVDRDSGAVSVKASLQNDPARSRIYTVPFRHIINYFLAPVTPDKFHNRVEL